MIQQTKTNKTIRIVCRWFVGLVFLFSSFTKGVDPLGTAYKIEEYMTAWSFFGLDFTGFLPLAPYMAMTLIVIEFCIGVMLITGSFRKLTAWLLALMMCFFTFTTLYDAITNDVSDCGCFGDLVKMTNWQTFWKNVVLDVPTVFIFLTRRWPRKKKLEQDTVILTAAVAAMVIFGIYNILHEPVLDFRAWKVGNKMITEKKDNVMRFEYQNKETQEKATLTMEELTAAQQADSTWSDHWQWVNTYGDEQPDIKAEGFFIMNSEEDVTLDIISSPDMPTILCSIHHIGKVNERGVKAIKAAHQMAMEKDIAFYIITNAVEEDLLQFLADNDLTDVEYYFGDEKALETMMRSNPGFLIIKDAVVQGKWHYRQVERVLDFPYEEL